MVVASISGIRGILNQDLFLSDIAGYVESFSAAKPSKEFLVGRDTRHSGEIIERAVCGTLMASGSEVLDYGVISTPALFRESRLRSAPAVMITASHNQPEWNGVKLVVNGRGISQPELDQVLGRQKRKTGNASSGVLMLRQNSSYNRELIEMAGRGTGEGVAVAVDLNGGAAIPHAPPILEGMGCSVKVLGGSQGIFSRIVDPTSDSLELLTGTVKKEGLDAGFAFDCDGDRLVLVDNEGEKRTGDFMLALAVKKLLPNLKSRSVVVSVDTTRAIDDVVSQLGGTVYRSKVGEANVVSEMIKRGATLGGEGSSGGLIDSSYNYCRDSMIAVVAFVKAIQKSGSRVFGGVPSYEQVRVKAPFERKKALAAIRGLQREHPEADLLDGIKLETSARSWVLIRVSGTEDAVRVSAESTSIKEAQELADSYLKRVEKLG
jgi:phosphoglucosamine mutase